MVLFIEFINEFKFFFEIICNSKINNPHPRGGKAITVISEIASPDFNSDFFGKVNEADLKLLADSFKSAEFESFEEFKEEDLKNISMPEYSGNWNKKKSLEVKDETIEKNTNDCDEEEEDDFDEINLATKKIYIK